MPTLRIDGVGTVDYDEVPEGSPSYTLANGTSRVDRTFRVAWNKRELFCKGMIGFPRIANTAPGTAENFAYVSRVLPQAFPGFRDPTGSEEWLYATAISRLVGVGPTGGYDAEGVADYRFAMITVQYESLTYKLLTDDELQASNATTDYPDESYMLRFITRVTKPSAEYITLPRGVMYWYLPKEPGGTMPKVDFANARIVPSMEVVYTWHQVPFVPPAVRTHIGSVNSTDFGDRERNYRPGTLLLLAVELKPYRTAVGAFVHDITYRMKYFEPEPGRGHNFFLRYNGVRETLAYTKLTSKQENDSLAISFPSIPSDPSCQNGPYEQVYPAGNSRGVYPYADFDDLFKFTS